MPNRRGHRTAAACLFCRQKKLRCDSVKPNCGNCLAKGIDCRQGPILHKPRPTNDRIAQLESENESLRQRFAQIGPDNTSPVSHHSVVEAETPHPEAPDNDRRSNNSLYHGPTSTAYDDTAGSNQENAQNPSEEWSRHLLFAQTAKQRQLEPLNLAANKLDFDGVDPEIGMHLLSIYWARQLYTAQIIYRPAFMRDMACAGPYFSKLLLNAIFFVVSKHSSRPEIRSNPQDITTAGWRFRQRFTELLRESFDKSEITTLQALLIMSNALFSRCDERSLSWLYAGNAFNMIIDLGLHVLPANFMSAEELEIRKRVLWGAYLIDKIQCLLQGRPPLLRHVDFNTPLKFLDDYDELDQFQSLTYTDQHQPGIPSMNVMLLTKLCELSTIIERILREVYSESTRDTRPSQDSNVSESIKSDLNQWRSSLPPQVDYLTYPGQDVLLPQSLCLLALYNVLVILSQRPLIKTTSNPNTTHESITACTAAANQIVQILRDYSQRFAIPSAPYMLSYATYISATIHARIVAQKGKDSNAFQSLLFCRNILLEHTRLYAAAGKAIRNLDKLIGHLGIGLGESEGGDDVVSNVEENTVEYARDTSISAIDLDLGDLSQMNWELSDIDLDAIAEGFLVDRDLHYLMHPLS